MFGLYLWLLHWETKLGLNPFSKPETKTPLSEFISDLHDIFIYENGTDIENGERCPEDCICDGDIIAIASRMLARGWTKKSETKTPTASADEKGNGND